MGKQAGTSVRRFIVIPASILLGGILVIAGVGKIPGQMEFADALTLSFWTPSLAILISRTLPWAEIVLGAALILGFMPRIAAVLSLPLIAGFAANNGWAILNGFDQFGSCSCFGLWETIFGSLTPKSSLVMDGGMLLLALTVITVSRTPFFTWRLWFMKGNKPSAIMAEPSQTGSSS